METIKRPFVKSGLRAYVRLWHLSFYPVTLIFVIVGNYNMFHIAALMVPD